MTDDLNFISFPEQVLRVIDLEELAGVPKENIRVFMEPHGWDLANLDAVATPGLSDFDLACGEAQFWLDRFYLWNEADLLEYLTRRYEAETFTTALDEIMRNAYVRGNPLTLALSLPYPIRMTLVLLALLRHYDSGGESVNISSDLPPCPPSPGHWGGRDPGYEEPLPDRESIFDDDSPRRAGHEFRSRK